MFIFMVDNERRIFEKDPNGGLSRGFMLCNTEVGGVSWWLLTFLYNYVCGNHIVWGAEEVKEFRFRHVGEVNARAYQVLGGDLAAYAESSYQKDEEMIKQARTKVLGPGKDEVVEAIYTMPRRPQALTQTILTQAYETAEKHTDWYGAPNTVWGMVQGLTQLGRDKKNGTERVAIDSAAGKLLKVSIF
jgi:hypothetical protein